MRVNLGETELSNRIMKKPAGRSDSTGPKAHVETRQKVSQSGPNEAKTRRSKLPRPQVERILCRHFEGQSAREIARREKRSRQAVETVIKSPEMGLYVHSMR